MNFGLNSKTFITDAQQQYVPTKTTSKRSNQPWFNHECKHEVCKKVRRYRVFKRTNLPKDWLNFQRAAKTCRLTCIKVYNTYIKQNFTDCADYGSNKKFFSFIKFKQSDIIGVPPLKNADGITHVKDKEISEL